jgi:DNA-binding MarR family transcriptional regulator
MCAESAKIKPHLKSSTQISPRKGMRLKPGRFQKNASKLTRDIRDVQKALGLFLFAHLNLAADADDELASLGFHRTHHRILYLVAGHPGTTVGDLIRTLRLTPQAVQSPMKQLNESGYIEQRHADADRRKRCLFIKPAGGALVARLSKRQHKRLAEAFHRAGPTAVKGFFSVMESMLTKDNRDFVERSSI